MTCRICDSGDYRLYEVKELHYQTGDTFTYVECNHCQCLQIKSIPENIAQYYPSNYYSLTLHERAGNFLQKLRLLPYYYSIFRRNRIEIFFHRIFGPTRFNVLGRSGIDRSSRILDVGCGNGYKYLFPLKELGFENVSGCDPFLEKDIRYVNGLHIRKTDISGIEGKWNLIMFHHSFEHVPNPRENMEHIVRLLSPGGTCLIRIPTVSSYAWRKYREYWYQLDAPRHFFLHSIKSMEHLASNVGLAVTDVVFDSNHKQITNSEKYLRGESLQKVKFVSLRKFVQQKRERMTNQKISRILNQQGEGDQAAFILRKKE